MTNKTKDLISRAILAREKAVIIKEFPKNLKETSRYTSLLTKLLRKEVAEMKCYK